MQYRGGISSVWLRIISTDVSHHQCGGGTSSVQWRVCSMDLSHHQYGGGCAVQDYLKARFMAGLHQILHRGH